MPLINYTKKEIEIEIPDVVFADTILKRKAKLLSLNYNQLDSKVCLTFIVTYYRSEGGEYGELITASGLTGYYKEIVADNSFNVNPTTGAHYTSEDLLNPKLDYIGQYDFFNMLAEFQPVKIHELITQYALQTNWN